MKKIPVLALIATGYISLLPAMPRTGNQPGLGAEISPAPNATHIGRISKDTLVVIAGSTYSFTVDTPEDQGLIATKINAVQLVKQINSKDGSVQQYRILGRDGAAKTDADLVTGDRLMVTSQDGKANKTYHIIVRAMAVGGQLRLSREQVPVHAESDITLHFTAGQRSRDATVRIYLPAGIHVTMENTTVNVIGRGEVVLKGLSRQSIGRVGTRYTYSRVGNIAITKSTGGGSVLTFTHLDLRPANGADLVIVIRNVKLNKAGKYPFKAVYSTVKPAILTSAGMGAETAVLTATRTIADFERITDKSLPYRETPETYTSASFTWHGGTNASAITLQQSVDNGKTWRPLPAAIDVKNSTASISGLEPGQLYAFKLAVKDGKHQGFSNTAWFYSGKMDIKAFGVTGNDDADNTAAINEAIAYLHQLGGGTLLFSKGVYSVRTVHLKSNVCLYLEKDAVIKAIKGADAPESTWFSDRKYRSGLSPTDPGPYADPENYLTKQDVGHHYFRNAMFFGERLDNVKIIGNGLITGNGNLVTGDRVMNNAPDNRADKMFSFKLCTNLEIGGIYRKEDLWYDAAKDEPYYIGEDGAKLFDHDNMLQIDRAGHFVLLATGTDNINVHNTYFGRASQSNVRDIYDFMACNNVTATNIYSRVSADDVIKPGSDCSLGFTRPAKNYRVRNIIGDTNCNLFQIGSETADDIMQVCVDNIYILGANKAGFSISTNDGGHVKDIHLNCGHTGSIHSRSKMYRATAPFFISISNRGRVLGADLAKYSFAEQGKKRDELLVKNVNIGKVENIILNGIDVYEVYSGSSFVGKRWKAFDGSQKRATSIIAGYQLPDSAAVEGRLDFKLPDGRHTGYIKNISFTDVHIIDKGGNPLSDTGQAPPELGVGQYNVSNLKVQPSYGLWARHVKGLTIRESSFNYEQPDGRYALFLDDVSGAQLSSIKMAAPKDNNHVIKLKNASNITIEKAVFYKNDWGKMPVELPPIHHVTGEAGIGASFKK